MKSMFAATLVTLFIVGCASVQLTTPTQADVDRVSGQFDDYSLADLKEGKTLFETKCTRCHGLKNPQKKDAEGWKKTVPRMVKKKPDWINDQEEQKILRYLITMSSAPSGG